MTTVLHRCLDELTQAENAWLDDKGNGHYIEWAHKYTSVLQIYLQQQCAEIDAAQALRTEQAAQDQTACGPPVPTVEISDDTYAMLKQAFEVYDGYADYSGGIPRDVHAYADQALKIEMMFRIESARQGIARPRTNQTPET